MVNCLHKEKKGGLGARYLSLVKKVLCVSGIGDTHMKEELFGNNL